MISAQAALERLQEGNRRFASGACERSAADDQARRGELVSGQKPFAVVLGCSDSRVPADIVFDQGLGDLFVIRVAGNIVASSQIGSVELAAERFGTRLVVVLGHSRCGAVTATLQQLARPADEGTSNLNVIIDRIRPAVAGLRHGDEPPDGEDLVARAVRANIRASVERLRRGSSLLASLIIDDGLVIVGAEYSLTTGAVEFLDG